MAVEKFSPCLLICDESLRYLVLYYTISLLGGRERENHNLRFFIFLFIQFVYFFSSCRERERLKKKKKG